MTLFSPQTSEDAPREVEFRYVASAPSGSVSVVGQFNEWDRARMPLVYDPTTREWHGRFSVRPGVWQYLYCEDGARWLPDAKAPKIADGNGNTNNKLVVAPATFDGHPGERGDGSITEAAVRHRAGRDDAVRKNRKEASLYLRVRAHDVERVAIETGGASFPMEKVDEDELYERWRGTVPIQGGETEYRFRLEDGKKKAELGPFRQSFAKWPLPKVPDWVKDAVFYQIFPDRFDNGDSTNDGPNVEPWGTQPTPATWRIRLGGDLAGIRRRMDHLESLGVNAIYLNPVFQALSNHAYDTVDYHRVDPRFGTNEELRSLVEEGHRRGIRTILDAVFNHASPDFFAFRDLKERGRRSRYRAWFFPLAYPIDTSEGQQTYRTFAGVPTMPKLNQDNPATRRYFLDVGSRWIREADIDGWRLDVADEVSHDFWRAFRRSIKRAKPDAYIVGEEWGDAHPWLQGDEHDAAMNYRWRKAVLDFFGGQTDAREFDQNLRRIRDDYPDETLLGMFNLLGSHDTERVKTVLKGDMDRLRQAVVFQFTYPGVPSIYYGDEIGLEGGKEPLSRGPMPWTADARDHELCTFYRHIIQCRRERVSLRRGNYRTLIADAKSGAFAFSRSYGTEETRVYFAGSEPLSLPEGPATTLTSGDLLGPYTLRPHGYAILMSHESR